VTVGDRLGVAVDGVEPREMLLVDVGATELLDAFVLMLAVSIPLPLFVGVAEVSGGKRSGLEEKLLLRIPATS